MTRFHFASAFHDMVIDCRARGGVPVPTDQAPESGIAADPNQVSVA